jgi:tetraacyldisaccharide 4'-kinase
MKSLILSLLRYISLPFALLYGVVVAIRNKFYDNGIFTSIEFSLPVICVGNITVGGTGKSPHIEYLIEYLKSTYKIATLSRGYKRYTRGFRIADEKSNARDIGDEPFQFKAKYPSIEVCVAEERMTAIPQLLQKRPQLEVILLDDAFQHRTVKAGLNILLTDYHRLYTRDYIMPFGLLRESKTAAKRAQIIIVSKCPTHLTIDEKQKLIEEIKPENNQTIYFSAIEYKNIYPLSETHHSYNSETEILLVCGIANPDPLIEKLSSEFKKVYPLTFKDHHYFTYDDIEEVKEAFDHITSTNKMIITTEKDASRLMLLQDKITAYQLPIYIQSIGIQFLYNEAESFNEEVITFIQSIIPPHSTDLDIEDDPDIIFEEVVTLPS